MIVKELCEKIQQLKEELEEVTLEKKLTEIIFRAWYPWQSPTGEAAWKPDVLWINTMFPHSDEYWNYRGIAIITHETIHNVLDKMGLLSESYRFDKLFKNSTRSQFLVTGEWELLKADHIFGEWKWNKKTS